MVLPPWPAQEHARVDFESGLNATAAAAAAAAGGQGGEGGGAALGAYLAVEVLLAKLEALTGAPAAAQSLMQYSEMYRWGGGGGGSAARDDWVRGHVCLQQPF